MSSAFSIRVATEDDLEAVLKIERVSYPLPWTDAQFRNELNHSKKYFLVYTDDETDTIVAGYIVFHDLQDETHILNVAVQMDWRGLGMGKKLIALAINHAHRRNHRRIFLEVRQENVGAIALYRKAGLKDGHMRHRFYADGADALFMELFIDPRLRMDEDENDIIAPSDTTRH